MSPNNLIPSVWEKLGSSSVPLGEKLIARLTSPDKSRKLLSGLDSSNQRHLLIPLEENEESYEDLGSKGLSIITREMILNKGAPRRYIDILCNNISGYSIFDSISEDIAISLDSGNPKEVVIEIVNKWRNFWDKPPKKLMSRNEIIGLFSEIWFLTNWLIPKMDNLSAVNSWRGPFSSRHDFEFTKNSVEVKSTTNSNKIHKINGLNQLSPPERGELFLFSLSVKEEQGAINSLSSIIALCKEKLKEDYDALSKFESTLYSSGYSPMDEKEYSKIKLRVVEERLYQVTQNFPRLTKDSFINKTLLGIEDIDYTINLEGYDHLCVAKSPESEFFSKANLPKVSIKNKKIKTKKKK